MYIQNITSYFGYYLHFIYSPCTVHVHVAQLLCISPISNLCFMHENVLSLDNCISYFVTQGINLFTQTYPNNGTLNVKIQLSINVEF